MFKPLALASAVLTAFSLNAFAATTELTVYTALEAEQLKTYKNAFEKANPDVEIKWVRDSTGIITAKLLATVIVVAWNFGANKKWTFRA